MRHSTRSAVNLSVLLGAALVLQACGDSGPTDPGPSGAFPQLLSELNIDAAGSHFFQPRFQLWTNGAAKSRTVRLAQGGSVNTSNRAVWVFPEGAIFTKTFSYLTKESPSQLRKIETRIIRLRNGQWEAVAYRWLPDQSDATLLEGGSPVPVTITNPDDSTFVHDIPSRLQCQQCHGVGPVFILGFNELQLNSTLSNQNQTQLQQFFSNGTLGGSMPQTPASIPGDALEQVVVGYLQGNCVHCHNSASTGAQGFNLSYVGFRERIVGANGPSGAVLLTAGDPSASAIYNRFSTGSMPALGVRLRDYAMIQQVQQWITGLQ